MKIDWEIVDKIAGEIKAYVDVYDRQKVYIEYASAHGHVCFAELESKAVASFIRVRYKELANDRNAPKVEDIVESFKDEAIYYEDLPAVDPHARIAGNLRSGIEYFLADPERRVVSVSNGTWDVTENGRYKFLSGTAHHTQVIPVKNDEDIFALLAPCINLHGDDLILFVLWLVQCFSGGSHYGLMLKAERGSGKTTLTKVVNQLLDPSAADAVVMPKKLDDLHVALASHYLCCFDNVRDIPTEHSDSLCTAITGGTVLKRELYTTRDAAYLHLHNCVIINGIEIAPQESDLAERLLMFHMQKLKPSELKPDFSISTYLAEKRPLILGCIFDALAKASVIVRKLDPKETTRMAGAYIEMLAVAEALGISEKEFRRLIEENVQKLHQACADSPLVEAVCEYMNGPMAGKRKVTQTATQFFTNVRSNYSGNKGLLGARAAEFSKRLKMEHDALFAAGFSSMVDDSGAAGSTINILREKN